VCEIRAAEDPQNGIAVGKHSVESGARHLDAGDARPKSFGQLFGRPPSRSEDRAPIIAECSQQQATPGLANDGQGDDDMSTTTAHGRLRIAVALAALASASLLAASPAHAAGATSAVCVGRIAATFTPGLRVTPSSGAVTTNGETGSITCVGKIGGHRVTGPGSFGVDYTYAGATCAAHAGSGTARITLPTTGGTSHMVGAFTNRRVGLVIRPEARFPGARFSGIGVAIPTHGTCFVTPLTRVAVSVTASLTGA
jgi:hypothetical protein